MFLTITGYKIMSTSAIGNLNFSQPQEGVTVPGIEGGAFNVNFSAQQGINFQAFENFQERFNRAMQAIDELQKQVPSLQKEVVDLRKENEALKKEVETQNRQLAFVREVWWPVQAQLNLVTRDNVDQVARLFNEHVHTYNRTSPWGTTMSTTSGPYLEH
jgi:regulator of replication initiation timing